jgi:uncharacterized protein YciI
MIRPQQRASNAYEEDRSHDSFILGSGCLMARWVCVFDDTPEMLAIRAERRSGHLRFLKQNADQILRAGPLSLNEDAPPAGGLWVLNVASRNEAVLLIEQDPYYQPQYRTYRLFEWKWALDYPDAIL